jgi:hypothetical protein
VADALSGLILTPTKEIHLQGKNRLTDFHKILYRERFLKFADKGSKTIP